MFRLNKSFLAIVLPIYLFTGCSDSGSNLLTDSSLSQQDISPVIVDDGSVVFVPGENEKVFTSENISEGSEYYRGLFRKAVEAGYDGMSVKIIPGKPAEVTYWKFEDAVLWDGSSPLDFTSGVRYRFKSPEDMVKALEDRPGIQQMVKDLLDLMNKKD